MRGSEEGREAGHEEGQAAIEWTALLALVAIVLAGLGYAVVQAGAWRFGDGIVHALTCALGGGCAAEEDVLTNAYGPETAKLVRRYSPNMAYEARSAELPIDFRRCRQVTCSNGPDEAREIDRSSAGLRVMAFTRVVDRRAQGGSLYLQYWFYYPESFTAGIGRIFGHRWPGFHRDDWEGVQVRLPSHGPATARATAHGGYGDGWTRWTGWYRVSGGSHAGQVVDPVDGSRTTSAAELVLVPLESLAGLGSARFAVTPPWLKQVYGDPESAAS